jgi:AcrR family transcriptional regulator|tara:strand:- start:2238 stop:2861 length:624 start_codon:yes stop_codon:yes gene_type:complete
MRKGEKTRAIIVDEGVRLASLQGLEALSIGDLARRLSLSKSGLFGHFGSKDALKLAVLERMVEQFTDEVLRPALNQESGLRRLETFFDGWVAWIKGGVLPGGCPLVAAAIELDDQPGALKDYLADQQRKLVASLARMTAKAVAEGSFRADLEVEQFAFEVYALGQGSSFWLRLLGSSGGDKRVFQAFHAMLARAARAAPGRPNRRLS